MRTRLAPLLLALVGLAILPAAAQPAAQAEYADLVAEARQMVTAHLAEHNLPGLGVAVSVRGETVWSDGFGFADLEQGVPITPLSRFRIGSISKPLAATAIAQLYHQGRLDVDAPVQQYVPYFPEKAHMVTTRQLGAHLAGIRHYNGDEFLLARRFHTVEEGIGIFKDDPLLHPPGSQYAYTSYGWNLISAVVEGASGEDFLAYMDAHVFRPLGMIRTGPDRNEVLIPNRVRFYQRDLSGALAPGPYVDNSYKWAGGGFLSTPEDLLRFANGHMRDSFLPDDALALLWTEQQTTAGNGVGYGFGWRLRTDDAGRRYLGHTGGSVGGSSVMFMQPETEVVVVVLVNLSSANTSVAYDLLTLFVEAEEAR